MKLPNLPDLLEKRGKLVDEMSGLVTKELEGALSDEERARFESLDSDVKKLDATLANVRRVEELERRAVGAPVTNGGEFDRELRGYSVAKAAQESLAGRLTGREAEFHQELSKGRETRGVMVPTQILLGEARSQTVGAPSAGGVAVATNLGAMGDRFRPALKIEALGATVMRDLTGFLDLPQLSASGSSEWVAEDGAPTESAATFEKISMGPKTVSGQYRMSRRLLLQTGTAIEEILRRDLGYLLAQALDSAAIKGGGANEPVGILSTVGIEKVTTETAFSDTTANLIAALEMDDVTGTNAFLTSPKVAKANRKVKDGQNHVIPLAELYHAQRVEFTTQVPDNIGAGNDKSALIYGQWSELILGYWSAVDILVSPYADSVASKGGALLHAFLDADVAVRHVKAFSYGEI